MPNLVFIDYSEVSEISGGNNVAYLFIFLKRYAELYMKYLVG